MPAPDPADRIPAKTDAQARKRYIGFLQQSLSAVCKNSIWQTLAVPNQDGVHAAFTRPEVVTLHTRTGGRLYLRASQRFGFADHPDRPKERKVYTTEYAYTLAEDERLNRQLCSWEWQPQGGSAWTEPHAHVRRGHPEAKGLGKLHIPTGRVAYEQVLLFAITDYDVQEVSEQALKDLHDSLRRFLSFKTW